MKASVLVVALVAALGICPSTRAADMQGQKESVVDPNALRRLVDVDAQLQGDDQVVGTVSNRSPTLVREVKVAIQFVWLWTHEMRPGTDDPGFTDFYVVPDDIPPGGRARFTYRPRQMLPRRSDGHFEVEARVVSLVQVEPAPAMAPGTSAAPPRTAP